MKLENIIILLCHPGLTGTFLETGSLTSRIYSLQRFIEETVFEQTYNTETPNFLSASVRLTRGSPITLR